MDDVPETRKKRPVARALYKFQGQQEHELSFSPGESILLLKRVDDNWLEGEVDGMVGIFPANRVKIEVGSPSLSKESALARSGKACGVVLYNFNGGSEGDLVLQRGQIVELLGNIGSGWMRGRLNDAVGIFPSSFIEVLQPLATQPSASDPPTPSNDLSPSNSTTELSTHSPIDDVVCNNPLQSSGSAVSVIVSNGWLISVCCSQVSTLPSQHMPASLT